MEERTRPVVVAVDGSATDLPLLSWAAEEASSTRRPLMIAHAAGHLPPQMTYAERHVARQERREVGLRTVNRAAEWVRAQAPGLAVETAVRLLDAATLLPAVARDAHTLAQSGKAWTHAVGRSGRAPVLAVADGSTLDFAAGYANRRGVDLVVVDGHGPDVARRLLEQRRTGSLLLLPRPEQRSRSARIPWPTIMEIFARSSSPVALVGETTPDGARRSLSSA